jgi:hypothetical protein
MKVSKTMSTMMLTLVVLGTCGDSCWPTQAGSGFPVDADFIIVDSSGNIDGVGGVPDSEVSGFWLSDDAGATGSVYNFDGTTNDDGVYFVANGRIYANWQAQVSFNPGCASLPQPYVQDFDDVTANGFGFTCTITVDTASANESNHFAFPGEVPSALTSYGDFSTAYGEPELRVYQGAASPGLVTTVAATSAVAGVSADFPFPTQSDGSPLAEGFYALTNTNKAAGGSLTWVDSSYLAVGSISSLSSAFGIDAVDIAETVQVCNPKTGSCTDTYSTRPVPVPTQYYSGQVISWVTGAAISVESEPVAVKTYGSYTKTSGSGSNRTASDTGPAYAIVANSGSSSVSIVGFESGSDLKNIAVGARPMALTLNSAGTYAYVASFGSGSLAEIDLSSEAVTRTVNGLNGALSVAMDPSGSYVWVGGTNAIYKVSLSTFTVVGTASVTGSVTSLAASNAQNELVYTLVENCCVSGSTYAANEMLVSNLSRPGSYANGTAEPFAQYTMEGTLPTAAALPQATTVVSARFSNGMAASSTPTGFVIYDLVTHQQIMTGTTPTPVRGIASDPDAMYAYFTLPDSNEYVSVPLEYAP